MKGREITVTWPTKERPEHVNCKVERVIEKKREKNEGIIERTKKPD